MASVPITDVNSIILVSNTLSTLTSKPNEINLNSAVSSKHKFKIFNFKLFKFNNKIRHQFRRKIMSWHRVF